MKAELKNGCWYVDSNSWDANTYTQDQAEKYAETLMNCSNCRNCSACSGCISCSDCSYCSNCSYCRNCSYCSYCRNCSNCRNCRDCISCSDFELNPQRITSAKIGSRFDQSTYYFTDKHEQIVCGCFKGTLQEFEDRVNTVHGDSQHGKDYFKWIKAVKDYKEASK